MAKIKVTADAVLAILQGIMSDEDNNYKITDPSAPVEWQGKTIQEILNVDYYTFRHRPMDTEQVIAELLKQSGDANILYALNRAFCLLSLNSTERVFSKDNDIVTVSASLEYWLPTQKVKLLENLVEDMSIETNGIRIPVEIGGENRQVLLAFGGLGISEIQEGTEFGEMSICELQVDLVFYSDVVSRSDYTVEFAVYDATTETQSWVKLPFSSLSISCSMTQKAIPLAQNARNVGNINLSRVKSIVLAFDGYVNDFIDKITAQSLVSDSNTDSDNNEAISMRLTRGTDTFIYDCVIKDHLITIQEDTGNETHSLTLTTRGGVYYGSA